MVANIFKVKGMNIHLSYELYSNITQKCIERDLFSTNDMYSTAIVSSQLYPVRNKKISLKIYKSVCEVLKDIADKDYDKFIKHYYNQSYYGERAKENISAFLEGVATIYKHLYFRTDAKSQARFSFGKKFSICCKASRKHYTEIIIDIADIECYFGSVDSFFIHFKSGFTISFYYGNLSSYNEV